VITIQGHGFQDVAEAEVLRLPEVGEAIETEYGTCVVSEVDPMPDGEAYDGKVVCRLP
jgi:hypothetical protein